jgi:tRNA(Ile)-lysidine synthase
MVFEETSGTSLEHVHIRALIMLAERGIPHSSVSLPEQMRAVIENGALCFVPDQKEKTEINYTQELREGEISPCEGVKIKIERYSAQKKERNPNSLLIAPSVFFSGAYFRPKRDGDTVCVRNINKKVKKLFNEKKVPLNVREKLPILVRDDEILWIPGIAVCDRLREDIINGETDLFRITVIID